MKGNYQTKIIGLLFLGGGICFLGDQLGFWNFSIFFPGWWTIFLLLPAIFSMIDNGIHFGNSVLFFIGVYFLIYANGWIDFRITLGSLIALVCILVGLKMIVGNRKTHKEEEVKSNKDIHTNVLIGSKKVCNKGLVNSIDAQCMLGYLMLDLSEADVKNMEFLRLNCVLGNIDLIVSSEMNFVIKKDNVLGSCVVSDEPIGKYDLYVDVSCVLGEVNLKKKKVQNVQEGEFKEK